MGKICQVSPPGKTDRNDPDFNLDDILSDKSAWTEVALTAAIQNGVYVPTGETFQTAYTMTKIARKCSAEEAQEPVAPSNLGGGPIITWAETWTTNYATCRLLFTTATGHMGLGPRTAQVGDLVYLLLGGEGPFILRPKEQTGTFQFIGECYVHGLMKGEGLVAARKRSRPTEDPPEDTSWLDHLDELEEDELPFETEVVTLV